MSSRRYTDESRAEAVKQVLDRGHSVVDVAGRLGINKHSLYEWIKRAKSPGPASRSGGDSTDTREVRRLRAELRRVTEERDILKKAAAYFLQRKTAARSDRWGGSGRV